jgi:hypothetical protein
MTKVKAKTIALKIADELFRDTCGELGEALVLRMTNGANTDEWGRAGCVRMITRIIQSEDNER